TSYGNGVHCNKSKCWIDVSELETYKAGTVSNPKDILW
uniref:Bacteriocin lactococcin MMFII n=2 Tax=Lactococcus TaxID=1357 RepID=LCNM_LACLL|nr:RecName: Full=Bacteriocin lactococcin MMFII [Lactococcus lactis subsp. lactis]